jgi:broad specificity polyphosphatase/5'/3'-nucleotidase SurE
MLQHTILITNDDGVEAQGLTELVQGLHDAGYPLIVCAPDRERSASTMHLTLHKLLRRRERDDLLSKYQVDPEGAPMWLFDVSGYPADCILAAIGGGLPDDLPTPSLCISGINRGPNMSVDILHSGTIGGARQAATSGLPAISTSLDSFEPTDFQVAVKATIELADRLCRFIPVEPSNLGRSGGSSTRPSGDNEEEFLRSAICNGDVFLNLNVPVDWEGQFSSTHLGGRWYREHIKVVDQKEGEWMMKLGSARIEDEPFEHGDSHCVSQGRASVSTLGTWPQGHPLSISDKTLANTIDISGLPSWLSK